MQTLDQMINKTSRIHIRQETKIHKKIGEQRKLEDTKDNGDQIDLNSSQEEQKPRESSSKLP